MAGSIESGGHIRADAQVGSWGSSGIGGFFDNFTDSDYHHLRSILAGMDPNHVDRVGTQYEKLTGKLNDTMDLIQRQITALGEAWSGDAAKLANTHLTNMRGATDTIQGTTSPISQALQTHAATQRRYQAAATGDHWYGVDIGTGGTGVGDWFEGEGHIAKKIMHDLQVDTVNNNKIFPQDLQASIPEPSPVPDPPATTGPGGGTPAPGINPNVPSGNYFIGDPTPKYKGGPKPPYEGDPTKPIDPHGPVIGDPPPPIGPPTKLTNYKPPPNNLGPGAPPPPSGGPGGGSPVLGPNGLGMLPLGGGLGSEARLGNGLIGDGLDAGAEEAAAEAAEAEAGLGADGVLGGGRMMPPGRGGEDDEYEREVNLTEDDKSWAEMDGSNGVIG